MMRPLRLTQEYKVSSCEQRLISEIEYRLERSPVEESGDEAPCGDTSLMVLGLNHWAPGKPHARLFLKIE